jgi:type I restriction enzyme S subunit
VGEVPVVSSSGITGFHNQAKAQAPGVVTGRYGTLGEVYYVDRDYWPLNTALYVVDFKGNHPRFVYYLLANALKTQQSDKAAVPGVNRNVLHEIEVRTTEDPEDQAHVANKLSAFDDLIEINRKRIALLQQAARELYNEWFVRLRFPGHEHTRVANGIPEGWKRQEVEDLCSSIDYGYTASAQPENVGPKFLRITDIVPESIDWSSVPHCAIEDGRLDKFRLITGDIVIARTGATVGYAKRLHKKHPEAVFASYLVRVRLRADVSNLLVGTFIESDSYKAYVQSRIGGAAQPNANARVLGAAELLVPPLRLQRAFDDIVEQAYDQREILCMQNEKLRDARDLLLPRLMSGENAV